MRHEPATLCVHQSHANMQTMTSTQKRSRPASLSYQEIRKQCSLEGQANLDRFYDDSLTGLTQPSPQSQETSPTPQNTGTSHEMQTRSITDIIIDDNHAVLLQTARALKTPLKNKTTTTPRPSGSTHDQETRNSTHDQSTWVATLETTSDNNATTTLSPITSTHDWPSLSITALSIRSALGDHQKKPETSLKPNPLILTYYGMSFNVTFLEGSTYLNFFLLGLARKSESNAGWKDRQTWTDSTTTVLLALRNPHPSPKKPHQHLKTLAPAMKCKHAPSPTSSTITTRLCFKQPGIHRPPLLA